MINIGEVRNAMKKRSDRCNQLHTLHDRLVDEVRLMSAGVQEEEEGFENPIEMHNIIRSLQTVLHQINLELQKCPPEE
jgi:hypothetical protein